MKKATKIIALSIASAVLLSGAVSFGAKLAKQVEIYYRNIKINIGGSEITPKNADGETVEPFIYDGTTYLPVRAVADAIGMDVEWDDETSTVFLKDKDTVKELPAELTKANELYKTIDSRLSGFLEKGELDKEIVMNIEGYPVTAAELRYAVIACGYSLGNKKDEETKALMASQIDEYFRTNASVINTATELGLDLTDEEFEKYVSGTYTQMKAMYGDSLGQIIEAYTLQSVYSYFRSTYINALFSKITDSYRNDEATVKAITADVLAEMNKSEKPYVRAKHILIAFEENATDEQKAATYKKAGEVYAKALAGENFDMLIKQYGEDPGMTTYKGGYYFVEGKMVEPFEKASFALKEGEISSPVETTYGYHIIQRLPLDDSDALTYTDEFKSALSTLVNTSLTEKGKEYTVVYAENYEEKYAGFEKELDEAE